MVQGVFNRMAARKARAGLAGTLALTCALALPSLAKAQDTAASTAQAAVTPENHNPTLNAGGPATDGPGKASPWSYAGKQGIGASYEAYKDYQYSDQATTGTVFQGVVFPRPGRADRNHVRPHPRSPDSRDAVDRHRHWPGRQGLDRVRGHRHRQPRRLYRQGRRRPSPGPRLSSDQYRQEGPLRHHQGRLHRPRPPEPDDAHHHQAPAEGPR